MNNVPLRVPEFELDPDSVMDDFPMPSREVQRYPVSEEAMLPVILAQDDGERKLLEFAISRDTEIVLGDLSQASPDEVFSQLDAIGKATAGLARGMVKTYPLLGKLLVHIQDNKLYEQLKYESWNQFLDQHLLERLEVSKATAKRALTIAREFPSLTGGEVTSFGLINVMDLKKAYQGGEDIPQVQKIIEEFRAQPTPEAQKQYSQEFRQKLREGGLEDGRVLISFWVEVGLKRMWDEFVSDPQVQAYAQTKMPSIIFDRMIAECSADWRTRGGQVLDMVKKNKGGMPNLSQFNASPARAGEALVAKARVEAGITVDPGSDNDWD
jgi:hypothetical protein